MNVDKDAGIVHKVDKAKNGHKLPTGQWYAPSAVINVAEYSQNVARMKPECSQNVARL